MPDNRDTRCTFIRPTGERCRVRARAGGTLCGLHDPAFERARREGRSRGGRVRAGQLSCLPETHPDFPTSSLAELGDLLGATINLALKGKLDVRIANAVVYAASVKQRVLADGELERRLAALEQRLEQSQPHTNGRYSR